MNNEQRRRQFAVFSFFLFTFSFIILFGCENPFDPINDSAEAGYGRVAISINSTARTVFPTIVVFEKYVYEFAKVTGGTDEWEQQEPEDDLFTLEHGEWKVRVTAFAKEGDDRAAAIGTSATFTVGSTTALVSVKLAGNTAPGSEGTFSYTMTYPAGAEITAFTLVNLLNNQAAAIDLTEAMEDPEDYGGTITLSGTFESVPAGCYFLTILLKNNDTETEAGANEVVYIYSELDSVYEMNFTEDHFFALIGLEVTGKDTYLIGEELDIVVIAIYNKGERDVSSAAVITGFEPGTLGPQNITVSYGGKTKTFIVTVNPLPTYGISLSNESTPLNETSLHTFPIESDDITHPYDVTPLVVTVSNTGNQETGPLTAALNADDYFMLTEESIASIPAGAAETFTVKPISELPAGTYTATVTVSGGNGITAQSFNVSFTVFDLGSTDDLEFELIDNDGPNDNTYRVMGYEGTDAQIVIPAYYRDPLIEGPYLPVTEIGDLAADEYYGPWPFMHGDITSVIIGENVTSIGKNAFESCSDLTNIIILGSVTKIGSRAFVGTGLTDISAFVDVTEIGSEAFSDCTGLINITIPSSVTSIGWQAFTNCSNLISVTFERDDVNIGNYVFPPGNDSQSINDYLKPAYETGGAGTYTREINGYTWTKCAVVDITGMTSISEIQNAIQKELTAENDVIVTGDCTINDINYINLTLSGRTITWKANYTTEGNIILNSYGDFILASGCTISSSANGAIIDGSSFSGNIIVRGEISAIDLPGSFTIGVSSNSGIIKVDGGTINAKSYAIVVQDAVVIIKDGSEVTNTIDTDAVIRLEDDGARLAILGGYIGDISTTYAVGAFGTSEVYLAGDYVADGGIVQEGSAEGYYATAGLNVKFSGFTNLQNSAPAWMDDF